MFHILIFVLSAFSIRILVLKVNYDKKNLWLIKIPLKIMSKALKRFLIFSASATGVAAAYDNIS